MSLLRRLARTLRPSSLNPTTTLRAKTQTQPNKTISSNFFSSHSVHRIGLGRRFSSSFNYERNFTQNRNLLYGLIGLNTGIFTYGAYLQAQARQGFQEPAIRFLRNMTLNVDEVFREGKWWTVITCVFMHTGLLHLGFNMLSTYYLGGLVATIPGITPVRFLTIVLGSGITGSIGYLALRYRKSKQKHNQWGFRVPDNRRGLGFSGAVTGLGVVAAFVYPNVKMMVWGIIPVPLWALMLGFVVSDGYYLNDDNGKIAHAGHLGGAAFGLFYFMARMRRLRLLR